MWANPQILADLVTFTEEILMKNFIFCAVHAKFLFKVKTMWLKGTYTLTINSEFPRNTVFLFDLKIANLHLIDITLTEFLSWNIEATFHI